MKRSFFDNLFSATLTALVGQFQRKYLQNEKDVLDLHLKEQNVFGSTIPIVFGRAKVDGKVIFQRKNQSDDKFTIAVAICEGPIQEVTDIWINDELIANDKRPADGDIFLGTADQTQSTILKTLLGDEIPAFTNLAYVVFKDFALINNKIPKFKFAVLGKKADNDDQKLESQILNVALHPANGEGVFGMQTITVDGKKINNYANDNKTDAQISLENLEKTFSKSTDLANDNWLLVKVAWFVDKANDPTAIKPAVEFVDEYENRNAWKVATYNRSSAYRIKKNTDGELIAGGTPSDDIFVGFLQYLKGQNYKILLSPVLQVNDESETWRGEITTSDITTFFNGVAGGYRYFIIHYVDICLKNDIKIDGFAIGNALKGITDPLHSYRGELPFVTLAEDVKSYFTNGTTNGGATHPNPNVKITYIADWNEYHSCNQQFFHLDPLWSDASIDFVAINAYFPLTNEPQMQLSAAEIEKGWRSGEGWDYIFDSSGNRIDITDANRKWAWKNIDYWWENNHVNSNGQQTSWSPKNKEIWFAECGFASIDAVSNRPSFFYDGTNLPPFSRNIEDQKAQKVAMDATLQYWKNSTFMKKIFFSNWDLRPFTENLYQQKNWYLNDSDREKDLSMNEKFDNPTVGDIISQLAQKININNISNNIYDPVLGYFIKQQAILADVIDRLSEIYRFSLRENDTKIETIATKNIAASENVYHIDLNSLIPNKKNVILQVIKNKSDDLPTKISLIHFNTNFEQTVTETNFDAVQKNQYSIYQDMVVTEGEAEQIVESVYDKVWQENEGYELQLGLQFLDTKSKKTCETFVLRLNDILIVENSHNASYKMRILEINFKNNEIFQIRSVKYDENLLKS